MSMVKRLAGKRCLITGGTRGLGRAIAEAFAREGARVAVTFRSNEDDAEETRQALAGLGCEPQVFRGSVSDGKHAQQVFADLNKAWGGVDVLVNNAGIQQVMPIALIEEGDWDEMIATNLKGSYLFSRAALRGMIRQKRGAILCVGAFSSERMIESPVHYAAAKSGLRGFVEALAREVGRHNVQVNLLSPGLLDVGMGKMLLPHRINEYVEQSALGRLGSAAELAQAAVFLVSDENSFMTGAKLAFDGGL